LARATHSPARALQVRCGLLQVADVSFGFIVTAVRLKQLENPFGDPQLLVVLQTASLRITMSRSCGAPRGTRSAASAASPHPNRQSMRHSGGGKSSASRRYSIDNGVSATASLTRLNQRNRSVRCRPPAMSMLMSSQFSFVQGIARCRVFGAANTATRMSNAAM
jgi:hypothetical protein